MIKRIKDDLRWLLYKGLYKPGHFYSTIPAVKDVVHKGDKVFNRRDPLAIDQRNDAQRLLLNELSVFIQDFNWTRTKAPERRYFLDNSYFNAADAFSLYALMRHLQPKRIIEIGSGFSSVMMMDTNELFLSNKVNVTLIEPFPERLQSLVKDSDKNSTFYRLIPQFIQDVEVDIFAELKENDILFIDSSHVSKIGSDLNHIFFEIIPRLEKGVYIHFHDIFYPLEYPKEWIKQGIYWNEIYLLRAFLMFNSSFEIVLFNSHWNGLDLPGFEQFKNGGSLWIKKTS